MTIRAYFFATGITLLLTLGALAMTATTPARAADTPETSASLQDEDFAPAKALVDAGQYEQALTKLKALDAKTPDNADVLNLIGFSLRKTGHMDSALTYYNKALALNPDHRGANEYLGELYVELKQPAKAKERLEILRRICTDCEEFHDLQAKIAQMATAN